MEVEWREMSDLGKLREIERLIEMLVDVLDHEMHPMLVLDTTGSRARN